MQKPVPEFSEHRIICSVFELSFESFALFHAKSAYCNLYEVMNYLALQLHF